MSQYNADYFLYGKEKGISLYENYRWIPELTVPMVCSIVSHCGIEWNDTIIDFGCARGYVVKAFQELGYAACGYDKSEWAIDNADPAISACVTTDRSVLETKCDWIIAKDVLEHIGELFPIINTLMGCANKGVFVVVPLGSEEQYNVPEYEKDITHIHRQPLHWWVRLFLRPGWSVTGEYRVEGIKDNYAQHEKGNGVITCRRL